MKTNRSQTKPEWKPDRSKNIALPKHQVNSGQNEGIKKLNLLLDTKTMCNFKPSLAKKCQFSLKQLSWFGFIKPKTADDLFLEFYLELIPDGSQMEAGCKSDRSQIKLILYSPLFLIATSVDALISGFPYFQNIQNQFQFSFHISTIFCATKLLFSQC